MPLRFKKSAALILITTAALSALAAPANAQSKKEMVAQDQIMMQKIERLEARQLTGDPAAERLMQRMDALEESMRALTGEVERLRFERDQLRTEIQAEIQGATTQIQGLEGLAALASRMQMHLDAVDLVGREPSSISAPQPSTSYASPYSTTVTSEPYFEPAEPISSTQPNAVSPAPSFGEQVIEAQQYNLEDLPATGKTKLAEGDFSGAQTAFKQYLDINPDAADAGEVSFWLGESYFVRGGYVDAADAYISSMRKDPQGSMAPNAMVGLAATMRELGKTAEACNALGSLSAQYPNADAAVLEKARVEGARTGC